LSNEQLLEIENEIPCLMKAKHEMQQGVSFFSLMRNLTATGFFATKMEFEDVGYMGSQPNQWKGVAVDVLKQHRMEDMALKLLFRERYDDPFEGCQIIKLSNLLGRRCPLAFFVSPPWPFAIRTLVGLARG
jgi:hypothetical protein